MREKLNQNPAAQVALIGVLALVVGFFLLRNMGGSQEPVAEEPATEEAATAPAAEAPVADPAAEPVPGTVPPAEAAPAAPGAAAPAAGKFAAGPGLPKPMAEAYQDGKTVVLLVLRHGGIDDERIRPAVRALQSRSGIALFTSAVKHTARYSRVTEGVNLDRVPALIVLSPRKASDGPLPTASVDYGYRSLESVEQAVRDAGYTGPKLPYHPR